MTIAAYLENRLVRCRSRKTREAIYAGLAREYGEGFADTIRDAFEAHHLIVENERAAKRAAMRPTKSLTAGKGEV